MQLPRSGFTWHELMTTDTEGAASFYQQVAGLTTIFGEYDMLMDGEQPVGGMTGPTEEGPVWPSGGPEAHWVAYLGVDDVDQAVEKAVELGGEVLVDAVDIPNWGRVAVLRDPQGAAFGILASLPS